MSGLDNDVFATFLLPTLRNDIASFVNSHYRFALISNQPSYSLQSRFVVTKIGVNKAGMPSEHESLAIWVVDMITDKTHEFVIERAPSDRSFASRFSTFIRNPDSQAVLVSIQSAISRMRTLSSDAAESIFAALNAEMDTIPLVPLTNNPRDEATPLLPPTNDSYELLASSTSSLSVSPPISRTDTITLTLARAAAVSRAASASSSAQSLANDSISGFPPNTLVPEHCIRRFTPVELSLFELVLLAEVVHDYDPIYGLFQNQCYMFASVMFDVIVQLYSHPSLAFSLNPDVTPASTIPVPAPTPETGAPLNANVVDLPAASDQAGRWSGILIVDPIVKKTVVGIVISKFKVQFQQYINKVADSAPRPGSSSLV